MLKHLWSLVKKDIRLMVSGRFFIMVLCSLVLYSFYINFIYAKTDIEPSRIYLFDPMGTVVEASRWVSHVHSKDELIERVTDEETAIGIDYSKGKAEIIRYETGNESVNTFDDHYALTQILGIDNDTVPEMLGENNHEQKLRKEMTCEVLFFEIVAVGFIGIASLLFKEKQMGVMQVYGVMPAKRILFVLSKLLVFWLSDIIFAIAVILINIGVKNTIPLLMRVLPQVTILSIIMALLGFFFAMVYKNFKQFGFAYAFIIILMTSPIYLAANTAITWKWITYYPVYHLFIALKNAFFEIGTYSLTYYCICFMTIIILLKIVMQMIKKELIKG